MKQVTTTFFMIAFAATCFCQNPVKINMAKKTIKNYTITGTLMLASGAADGFNQALLFRYPSVKRTFPGLNEKFWNPTCSNINKYKNGDPSQGAKFPGSTTCLVFVTDGYHLTRFVDHLFMSGAVAVKITTFKKKKWYIYVAEAAGGWLLHRAGFCLVYNQFKTY